VHPGAGPLASLGRLGPGSTTPAALRSTDAGARRARPCWPDGPRPGQARGGERRYRGHHRPDGSPFSRADPASGGCQRHRHGTDPPPGGSKAARRRCPSPARRHGGSAVRRSAMRREAA
jgi:hypothetical protein